MTAVDTATPQLETLALVPVASDEPLTVAHANEVRRAIDDAYTKVNWLNGDLLLAQMRQAQSGDAAMVAADPPADPALAARCVRLSVKFPPNRRRAGLSWSHHEEVAGLTEADQDRLLGVAVRERLSVRALRAVIRQEHADLFPTLDLGEQWRPKWPTPAALRAVLAEVGDDGWVLVQPTTGKVLPAPAGLVAEVP